MKKLTLKFLSVCMFLCTAAGVAMRFGMFNKAYEYDELFTAVTSDPLLSFSWLYSHWLMADVHPPLYNFLLWVWNHFVPFGPELWLRLPCAFFGVGALACAWFFFPKRLGKTARGMFVALLACNHYFMLYAQHARSYMWVLLLSVPLTFLFLEMSRRVERNRAISFRQWGWFGALSLLLCWSHYFGALLFGLFSVFLFAQAVYYKRKLTFFIAVPCLVFILFLPWLIPNLGAQFEYRRFVGNWWANADHKDPAWVALPMFFFSDGYGYVALGTLCLAGLIGGYGRYKRTGVFVHGREMCLLAGVFAAAVVAVAVISLRTYLFLGRYFTAFAPCIYLLVVLLAAPLVRRRVLTGVLFVVFLGTNVFIFGSIMRAMVRSPQMPARLVSQIYRDYFPNKEMFVVALEAFPPAAMPAMYGFYANRVYGMNARVTELVSLEPQALEEALARKKNAFIWMPNCTTDRLKQVSSRWRRSVGVYEKINTVCFLQIFDRVPSPQEQAAASGQQAD